MILTIWLIFYLSEGRNLLSFGCKLAWWYLIISNLNSNEYQNHRVIEQKFSLRALWIRINKMMNFKRVHEYPDAVPLQCYTRKFRVETGIKYAAYFELIDDYKSTTIWKFTTQNLKQYTHSYLFVFFIAFMVSFSWYWATFWFLFELSTELAIKFTGLEYVSYGLLQRSWLKLDLPPWRNRWWLWVSLWESTKSLWLSSREFWILIISRSNFHSFFGFDSIWSHKQDCCDFNRSTACLIAASTLAWGVFFWLSISFWYSLISIAWHSDWLIS